METLKKYFPLSFQSLKNLSDLIINVLIQILAAALVEIVLKIVSKIIGKIPLLNLSPGLVGAVVGLYFIVGIVLAVLNYKKLLK